MEEAIRRCCGSDSEVQARRDWIRNKITNKDWYRVGAAFFFTLLHDTAGLFSAGRTIGNISFLDEAWERFVFVYLPIVIFDCGSEFMLIVYHDLPLVHNRPIPVLQTRIALVGQILTSILWLLLSIWVVYDFIFRRCEAGTPISECKSLTPGLSAALVVLMVWLRNSSTLKAYYDRFGVYPIICPEDFLFLHCFLRKNHEEMIIAFKKFNKLEEEKKASEGVFAFTDTIEFQIFTNFATLVLADIAAIASVTKLIIVPGDPLGSGLHALIVVLIIVLDISSEVVILRYHDIPIIKHEPVVHTNRFTAARIIQTICTLLWISLFIYMIVLSTTAELLCRDYCWGCEIPGNNTVPCDVFELKFCPTGQTCLTDGFCGLTQTGSCIISAENATQVQWSPPLFGVDFQNRTECEATETAADCILRNPSVTDCLLLGLVLIDGVYSTVGIFFRSYIYPITIPETVMFVSFLNMKDKPVEERHKHIARAAGRMQFGTQWDVDVDVAPQDGNRLVKLDEEGDPAYNKL